jgi:CHAT domain-containing protein
VFPFIPEYLKLWYARVNSPLDEGLLTMALMESDPDITEMAFEAAMTGKGIVIDALMAERTISYCVEDQNLPDMVQRHGQVCTEIAEQTLQKLQPNSTGIVPENLTGLYRIKDSLETAISQRCSEYESRLASSKTTVEQVTSAIPEGAVLWDIVAFSPWNFQPTNHRNSYHPRKYIGFVVSAGNLIQIVELGDAALIDSLIAEIRVNLANASTTISVQGEQTAEDTLSVLTAQLYSTIFEPLRAACSGVSRIFVSPDRNLNLIPFEILMQPSGRYVTEDFEISYLSSSRDLLKTRPIKPETANSAVLVISPDFDAIPARDSSPQLAQILSEPTVSVTRGLSENAECLAVPFDPLPAALDEGVAISGLLQRSGEFRLLQFIGAEASEDALKNLTFPPTVLHLTSHGFSCPQTNASPEKPEASPLLYSGLALAGANRAIYGEEVTGEDGILTAFEASALNLIGTELVVLSACRSGTGTIWSREGVFGLRRAFRHAGARCLIMSLFDVDDETTATLMRQFYNFWLSGGSVSSALRRARLSLITERRRSAGAAHPIYWGGFVLAGNPN